MIEISAYENYSWSSVVARPSFKYFRRVEYVLNTLQHHRSIHTLHIDDALNPQEIGAPKIH